MPVGAVRSSSASRSTGSPTLRQGSRGSSVVQLQNLLRAKGYGISADGDFGPKTAAAVRAFQRSRELAADGVVGPKTWAALRGGGGAAPAAPTGSGGGGGVRATGYHNGRAVSISISPVGNGKYMNSRAAPSYRNMIAAAHRAGINLGTTSGYRTMAQQQALWRRYGPPRAARPGYSNHQMGLSADISGIPGYNSRAYRWLKANAGKFGFVNDVRGEPWHWTYRR